MSLIQLLKKRPRILIYAGVLLLALLIASRLGINLYNLQRAWENAGVLWAEMFLLCDYRASPVDPVRMHLVRRLGLQSRGAWSD